MMVKAARFYVLCLFIIVLFLLVISLFVHVGAWVDESLYVKTGGHILIGALFTNFVVFCLARKESFTRNEFTTSPIWLRVSAIIFVCYGFGVAAWRTVLCSSCGSPDDPLTISAVPFAFEAMSMIVLYSVLWGGSLGATELQKKAGISFFVGAAVLALLLVNRLG